MALPTPNVRLPEPLRVRNPVAAISARVALALLIVGVNWVIVLIERHAYTDSHDGSVSVVDALYYTTVTLTTTGYGDITPVSTTARLINALVVTPMRLVFVILLVGTTLKALTQQSRHEVRLARWRRTVKDHVVVLGYGTKGRNAVRALLQKGTPVERIVVVDARSAPVGAAADAGHVAVQGDVTHEDTLRRALVDRAGSVIIALGRDDSAILTTLTVRRLTATADIAAAARESYNADLLRQSGASSVIVSSETVGRLLGLTPSGQQAVEVVEDLVSFGTGLDLTQRPVQPAEVGADARTLDQPVLAVLRGGALLHFDDAGAAPLQAGDEIIYVSTARTP